MRRKEIINVTNLPSVVLVHPAEVVGCNEMPFGGDICVVPSKGIRWAQIPHGKQRFGGLEPPLHSNVAYHQITLSVVCSGGGIYYCSETSMLLHYVVFRVVYIFGGRVKDPVNDLTPTFLTDRILATLRSADSVANKILQETGNKHGPFFRGEFCQIPRHNLWNSAAQFVKFCCTVIPKYPTFCGQ